MNRIEFMDKVTTYFEKPNEEGESLLTFSSFDCWFEENNRLYIEYMASDSDYPYLTVIDCTKKDLDESGERYVNEAIVTILKEQGIVV